MTSFYIDPAGNDSANGLSPTTAWRTLAKAIAAPLVAGDSLLFLRGGVWSARGRAFTFTKSGTSVSPITIGAYGTGPRPTIMLDPAGGSGEQQGFILTNANYVNLTSLRVSLVNPFRSPTGKEPDGQNVKLGWYVGFNITGHHINIDDCEADHLALGISLTDGTHHCRILNPRVHDLNAFWRIDGAAGAMGAIAVMVHGDDHEITGLLSERNWVECTRVADNTLQSYGAPFEIYNSNRCWYHHNRGYEFRKSFEMGHDSVLTCDNNLVEYNLFVSNRVDARGPNLHGPATSFGPVRNTIVRHNTVVLTGANSEAMVIGTGATGTQVYDNISSAVSKAIFLGSGGGLEHHNLYWGGTVQIINTVMSPTSKKLDLKLDANYIPMPGSPAEGMASDGGVVGALFAQGVNLMPVITDLQAVETTLRAQAATKASEATALLAQADKLSTTIVTLLAADATLNAAANVIDPG